MGLVIRQDLDVGIREAEACDEQVPHAVHIVDAAPQCVWASPAWAKTDQSQEHLSGVACRFCSIMGHERDSVT